MHAYTLTQKNQNWISSEGLSISIYATLLNYLKIMISVHKEKLMTFERIITMISSTFVDPIYAN